MKRQQYIESYRNSYVSIKPRLRDPESSLQRNKHMTKIAGGRQTCFGFSWTVSERRMCFFFFFAWAFSMEASSSKCVLFNFCSVSFTHMVFVLHNAGAEGDKFNHTHYWSKTILQKQISYFYAISHSVSFCSQWLGCTIDSKAVLWHIFCLLLSSSVTPQ